MLWRSAGLLSRRQFLGGVVASTIPLAGCHGASPGGRILTIIGVNRSFSDSAWRLDIDVTAHIIGKYFNRSGPAFRSVVLLGYDENRTRICERRIGDIPSNERRYETTVTMQCERMPQYLTFTTASGPCGPNTGIEALKYNSSAETYKWKKGDRVCDGGMSFEGTTE